MAIPTAILGASGYAGQETLDRVLAHPDLELLALGSDSLAGKPAGVLDPRLGPACSERGVPVFVANEEALAAGAELVFSCLDHERSAALPAAPGPVAVDLSGAHRLKDSSLYPTWYGFEHPAPETLGDWSYGLPELFPAAGPLIANPGCYATAVLLALFPLAEAIEPEGAIVDAKSGVSGAGKTLQASSHAGHVLENVSPYKVGSHQHAPELEQALGYPVCLVPHVLPVRRGLIVTCYVRPAGDLRGALEAAYAAAPAVTVLPDGVAPELARVQCTDGAEIGIFTDRATGMGIVICALDNLGKGAAGQAVQNANLALGLEETAGLRLSGVLV
ncbi:MAG: N-acetyl-gamma-glutamyl-phosphate reductase [Gaiellaceae bacterium MAG52_C11]|nr:N-acetyl-gamma-glutamyl-phosphate reductase [Candidatus Gaiellasilicea maunaloa]